MGDPGETIVKMYTRDIFAQYVVVKYGHQSTKLPLYVVQLDGPPCFGRDWLGAIHLDRTGLDCYQNSINILYA